jgi:hypothetical protein
MDPPLGSLRPTFYGFVATTIDAAYLVEAAVLADTKILTFVSRIPHPSEFGTMIRSGNVIVCPLANTVSWHDGRKWSPCLPLTNGFTLYRETTDDSSKKLTPGQLVSNFAVYHTFYTVRDFSRFGMNRLQEKGQFRKTIADFTLGV